MSRRFSRRDDHLLVTLSEPERELLRQLPDELRDAYESHDPADDVHTRLFPRAYLDPTEENAEREWQGLVHPELLRDRLDALGRIVGALDAAEPGARGAHVVSLAPDDVPALLGVLNDARLALGTQLGVSEDTDLAELDPDDPATYRFAVYAWLTQLEGDLIDTLLGDMPE
jgi:Domain of unknown function (DUF2017)